MEVPEFNPRGKETINQYIRRVEKYKAQILKEKYDIILNFVNEWLKAEYESLSEFTNMKEPILLKNKKHNRSVMKKYCQIFNDKFCIDMSITAETNSDEIKDMYIIDVLVKMLNIIDYSLIKKEFNNNIIYSIRQL